LSGYLYTPTDVKNTTRSKNILPTYNISTSKKATNREISLEKYGSVHFTKLFTTKIDEIMTYSRHVGMALSPVLHPTRSPA